MRVQHLTAYQVYRILGKEKKISLALPIVEWCNKFIFYKIDGQIARNLC